MSGTTLVEREWTEDFVLGSVRLRCVYQRRGKEVLKFTVQLEILWQDKWQPLVRYDNAHGFCHRDTIHADGTQEKTGLFVGDVGETFTHGIEDLKANWPAYQARFLKETSS